MAQIFGSIIQLMGKPVVRIVRYESEKKRVSLGMLAGQATIPDDFDTWPSEDGYGAWHN